MSLRDTALWYSLTEHVRPLSLPGTVWVAERFLQGIVKQSLGSKRREREKKKWESENKGWEYPGKVGIVWSI